MAFDAGSFRDPSGRVLQHDDRIFRAIFEPGLVNFNAFRDSGALSQLVDRGWLLSASEVSEPNLVSQLSDLAPSACEWIEHPRLDFVSYPYEWCFSQLRAAAVLHLNLHLALLEQNFTLSDATAYNIQFVGTRPVFIDHLSVIPYEDGMGWTGQRQFGMQFLNPLYFWARKRISPNAWYRGSMEGIEPEELVKLLGWRDRLSFTVLAHIVGPAAFARRRVSEGLDGADRREVRLPKHRLVALLTSLRDFITGLEPPFEKTVWGDYAEQNSYDAVRREAKHRFVHEAVAEAKPTLVFDIGCNSGDFSQTALSAGAKSVIGFDFDFGALERAFVRFDQSNAPVLPLWLNALNPSPAQGWAGRERKSLQQRASADMIIALAVIHHIAIAGNVPLDMAVEWLMGLAPRGVIEFPSKNDPMVRQLLRHREDIFPDYTEDAFLKSISSRGRILGRTHLGDDGRLIVAYERHR